jgi:hypothetical protein
LSESVWSIFLRWRGLSCCWWSLPFLAPRTRVATCDMKSTCIYNILQPHLCPTQLDQTYCVNLTNPRTFTSDSLSSKKDTDSDYDNAALLRRPPSFCLIMSRSKSGAGISSSGSLQPQKSWHIQ